MKIHLFVDVRATEEDGAAGAGQKLSYAAEPTVYFLPHCLPFAG